MKKISLLLTMLSCIAIINTLIAMSDSYDVKEEARKFEKKYIQKPLAEHPLCKKELIDPFYEDCYRDWRNEQLKGIQEYGLDAIFNSIDQATICSPLSKAILANDFAFAKFLLEHGANPNKEKIYPCGTIQYPIDFVKSLEMIQWLEDNGTDLKPLLDRNFYVHQDRHRICKYLVKKLRNEISEKYGLQDPTRPTN